ncbi:sulfatase-like hydrolase/transferase [Halapricum sp. CBA1109]|uniref:sulfatase n=1 Tax=Halapricum sp. CBA1109 TaxID=2668068 RepID=UPI0012F9B9DD|nr:sulfatase [Halapricum sp. CBA1109]MUV88785.1 sulfatase-like hydrolase/transferase [Halapricum sp. CBA1109]
MDERPHVVWITLDSVRADHTTMDGYGRDTTPNVAALADRADGQYLPNCFAHGKYTLTSTASMLTGTYPTSNGLGYDHRTLPEDIPSVPERFGALGYRTGGFSSNRYVSPETGLDRGFDEFTWIHPSTMLRSVPWRALAGFLVNLRRHSAGVTFDKYRHATAYLLNGSAKRWLRDGDDPVFLYAHYNEPHRPYYPPLSYRDRYTGDLSMSAADAGEFSMHVHENVERFIATGHTLGEDELDALRAMYDAEIRYTDECVRRLLAAVEGMDDREVVVVVTADHGELFGEYGLLGHKFVLKDELTRVPMVTSGLDDVADDRLVQHADVMETILDRVGGDTTGFEGRPLSAPPREFVVSQDHETDLEPYHRHNPDFDIAPFHLGDVSALRTADYRLHDSDGRTELFELPDQTTDRSGDDPDLTDRLAATLRAWLDDHDRDRPVARRATTPKRCANTSPIWATSERRLHRPDAYRSRMRSARAVHV